MFIVKLSNGCENAWERLQLSSISSFVLFRFEFIYSFFARSFNRCCQTCCFFN